MPEYDLAATESTDWHSLHGVAVVSFYYSVFSALIYGLMFYAAISEYRHVQMDHISRGEGYWREFESRRLSSAFDSFFTGILLTLSMMLMRAAFLLRRRQLSGISLIKQYASFQIIASLAFGIVLVAALAYSPVGILTCVGAVPSLLGCIYPSIVLIKLANSPLAGE